MLLLKFSIFFLLINTIEGTCNVTGSYNITDADMIKKFNSLETELNLLRAELIDRGLTQKSEKVTVLFLDSDLIDRLLALEARIYTFEGRDKRFAFFGSSVGQRLRVLLEPVFNNLIRVLPKRLKKLGKERKPPAKPAGGRRPAGSKGRPSGRTGGRTGGRERNKGRPFGRSKKSKKQDRVNRRSMSRDSLMTFNNPTAKTRALKVLSGVKTIGQYIIIGGAFGKFITLLLLVTITLM